MRLRERNTVLYHRLSEPFVLVLDDVRRVEEHRLAQARQRATAAVGGDHGLAERRLMQPLLHLPERIASLGVRLGHLWLRLLFGGEGDARFETRCVPADYEARDQRLVH